VLSEEDKVKIAAAQAELQDVIDRFAELVPGMYIMYIMLYYVMLTLQ
jgi:hypothetical protein